ncbi:Kinase family protein [Quillaja saponaria]|uniref:non-specific serine/threonine protein kinase n=1 Tax=Quillaja saponaria TaxID=32244 RepID=A0AAD7Q1Z9_QUISA|nr:Kinase family protein [Quillaja saponaria]
MLLSKIWNHILFRDNEMDSDTKPKKIPRDGCFKVKDKQGASFSSSASAQDLRNLDLEKEMEDPSSPIVVLESCVRSLDSNPTSPKNCNTESETHCKNSRALSQWSRFFKEWKRRSIKRLASFPPVSVPKIARRKSRSTREDPVLSHIYSFKSLLVNFSLSDLEAATNNFRDENLIGRGGFAEVYKGHLKNGQLIAVKRLTKGTIDEMTSGFLSELGILAHVDHPNIAKLVGVGVEGGMHLVFQLSKLGSLGSVLHGSSNNKLDWSKRYKISLGTADGLLYLHESCHRRIIHRDIKADNILLTEDCEPQICDFGLAKWLPEQWTHHNVSKFEGTFGYFAPEYFMHGIVDEKTDVYSFGVLLLELISGRPAVDHLQQSVVLWAKPLLNNNNIKDLVDPSLGNSYNPEEMDRVVLTASLCIEQSPILRPCMSQVVILLRADNNVQESANEWQRANLRRTYSEELLDAQEYNSTKFLSDLNRRN